MYKFLALLAFVLCINSPSWLHAQATPDDQTEAAAGSKIDPTGTWLWEQRFGGGSSERKVRIWSEDNKLTGVYESPPRRGADNRSRGSDEPVPITNLKVDGDKISFDVTRSFGNNEFTTNFVGVISGDEIAGVTAVSFGGQLRESAWMARRDNSPAATADSPSSKAAESSAPAAAISANPSSASTLLSIPQPMRLPDPGPQTEDAYAPRAILPGGIVMPLYAPDSPHLNQDRITEPEEYNLSDSVHGRINSIVNIHNPSIEMHFASPSMNTGAVVILAAGGGHRTLNVGTESADFVPYFYNYGVNTVILRNRLRSDGYEPSSDAVRDAMQAIRLVRKLSDQWKFDPQRIGIMGFSAGAELSAPAAVQFEQFEKDNSDPNDPLAGVSARPDFVGIIYPGPTPFTRDPEAEVPRNAPPAFIVCGGAGDKMHAIWALDYYSAMLRASIPNVEMHLYGNGRHPGDQGMTGGLTYRQGIPFGTWQDRFIEWFDDLGFLSPPGTETKAAADTQAFVNQPPPRQFRGSGRNSGRSQQATTPSSDRPK